MNECISLLTDVENTDLGFSRPWRFKAFAFPETIQSVGHLNRFCSFTVVFLVWHTGAPMGATGKPRSVVDCTGAGFACAQAVPVTPGLRLVGVP